MSAPSSAGFAEDLEKLRIASDFLDGGLDGGSRLEMLLYRGPYSLRHRSSIEYPNPFVPDVEQNSGRARTSYISQHSNADSSAGAAGQHAKLQYYLRRI